MLKLTYLGFYVSDDLFAAVNLDVNNNSVQTHNFAGKILKALSKYYVIYNLSCPSIVEYPRSKLFFTRPEYSENSCQKNIVFPLINIFFVKQFLQFIFSLFLVVRYPADRYVCHGLSLPYILTLILIKKLKRSSIGILVTDPPVSQSTLDGFMKRHFRRLYLFLVLNLIRNFDFMIGLSPDFKEAFKYEGEFLFIEGVP